MARPVTLFTGQWADLPLAELAPLAKEMGYDGLELACWGDHFDVRRALAEDDYCAGRRALLERHGLQVFAVSNHLVGQAVCDRIDARHQAIVPAHVWGDGDPEGVRARAADEMIATARAAAKLGVTVVNGFTGSTLSFQEALGSIGGGVIDFATPLDIDGIVDLARTRSYWLRSDAATRARVESNLRGYLTEEHPIDGAVDLPYMCLAYVLEPVRS